MPPRIPSRGFQVRSASFSPSGTAISITASADARWAAARLRMASAIIRRGAGLIAGSPTGSGSPGLVTMPTPGPALKTMPLPGGPWASLASMTAPWVTSGSSPASLSTEAIAHPSPSSVRCRGKAGHSPRGNAIVTGSGNRPVASPANAADAAAVAQAPVVQPRLNRCCARAIAKSADTPEPHLLARNAIFPYTPRIERGKGG